MLGEPRLTAAPATGLAVPAAFFVAALALLLLPGLLGPYGAFIDELYYVSCSERPAWGYVDQPPLAPVLLRAFRALLGDGLFALRLPAALVGALVVALAALLARRLGGGRFAQAMAAAAALTSPVLLVMLGFYSMNGFEILFWTLCAWLLVEIELRREPRLWLAFGVVAGLGLLNKHTMVLLALALAVGLVATPARRHLAGRWLWLGLALAAVLALPNLVWQASHDWPSLEFYRNASQIKNVSVAPLEVLRQQALFTGPGTWPLTLGGLVWLARRRPRGPELRHLAILYLTLLALVVASGQSRPDRIAGAYPLLFAAGGVALERWTAAAGRRRVRAAAALWLAVAGLALAPLAVPLGSPAAVARFAAATGIVPQIERGPGKRTVLPQWFADRLGWEQLVDDVAAARDRLAPEEREHAIYFAPSYGQAGALEWLGRARGLVPVYSTHNSWYLWGPPADDFEVAIVLGNEAERLERIFAHVELAGVHDCDFCMPWRDEMPIWIVRGPRQPIADLWPEWKHFE